MSNFNQVPAIGTDGSTAATRSVLIGGKDGSGNQQDILVGTDGRLDLGTVTVSGATGTQYTEGDTDASITGTAMLMEGAANALVAAQGTATDGLLVNLGSNNDVIQATASNLNMTEASAVAIKTAVELVDDTVATTAAAIPTKGLAVSGTDGTNARVLKTDTSGELQVDVLTMPTVAVTQSGTWDEVGINDSGNAITVDWAGTAPPIGAGLEATALRVTVATDSTGVLSVDDNAGSLTVDNAQLSVVGSGTEATAMRVTLASDSTGLLSVDDNGGSLTVDYATTGSGTATGALRVELPTNGTGVVGLNAGTNNIGDVDILTIAAGDNNIGNVDIASIAAGDNNIGNVDVLSVIPGTGATNAGKAVDTVAGATDTGSAPLAVRDDALGALTPIEGDYVNFRTDANGALWTHDDALDAALSGSELQVDVVGALPAGTNAIGKLAANSGVDIGDTDVTSIVPGTGTTNLGKAEDVAHGDGDVGIQMLAVRDDTLNIRSGAENDYEPLHTDANGALWTHPTDSVAHDAADAGNGIKVSAKAKTTLEDVTLVAANDRTDLYATLDGKLVVQPFVPHGDLLAERVSNTDGASTAFSTFGAGGATARNYITSISIHNAHATTNGFVDIRDGTAGSVIWTGAAPAVGGVILTFNPPLRQPTANTALAFDVSAAITTIYISITGYQANT